ncbi:hypothetical protein CDAR_435621 [Caerostris darwini]|uniref:Uncharacterized protein n=1 Tax=Caerostris darwini TaxID=1538125 RepID=A0AAV4PDQ0_9ARAC|nr:hypothetical protein CDAR_435621 [Caerostris darwini]
MGVRRKEVKRAESSAEGRRVKCPRRIIATSPLTIRAQSCFKYRSARTFRALLSLSVWEVLLFLLLLEPPFPLRIRKEERKEGIVLR